MDQPIVDTESGSVDPRVRDSVLLAEGDSGGAVCGSGEEVAEELEAERDRGASVDPFGRVGVVGADESGPHLREKLRVAEQVCTDHALAVRDKYSGLLG